MNEMREIDFKIGSESGIARFTLIPRDPKIKSVIFYSPECIYCRLKLEDMKKKRLPMNVVNVTEIPLLSSHFNITRVPFEVMF